MATPSSAMAASTVGGVPGVDEVEGRLSEQRAQHRREAGDVSDGRAGDSGASASTSGGADVSSAMKVAQVR